MVKVVQVINMVVILICNIFIVVKILPQLSFGIISAFGRM